MSEDRRITVTTVVLDDETIITLAEVCRACNIPGETVMAMVQEGVIRASQESPWRFPASVLPRIHRALRLQRDLDLNLPGVALALDLLDEIDELRARVQRLERLFEE